MTAAARLPFQLSNITLRVCADLGWSVTVSCPGCRTAYELNIKKLASKPLAGLPLGDLVGGEYLKCRDRCGGMLASRLSVSFMQVGMLRELVRWEAVNSTGSRWAQLVEPPAG